MFDVFDVSISRGGDHLTWDAVVNNLLDVSISCGGDHLTWNAVLYNLLYFVAVSCGVPGYGEGVAMAKPTL